MSGSKGIIQGVRASESDTALLDAVPLQDTPPPLPPDGLDRKVTFGDEEEPPSNGMFAFVKQETMRRKSAANVRDSRYSRAGSAAVRGNRVRSVVSKSGRPWEYAIQMPAWDPGDKGEHEIVAAKIVEELVRVFGQDNVRVKPKGSFDSQHAYIKVTADRDRLEEWAEEDRLRVRVVPWRGGGHREFSRALRYDGLYQYPGIECETLEEFTNLYGDDQKIHEQVVFVPYQIQWMIREHIIDALDSYYRTAARQAAMDKNQGIMHTHGDVLDFLKRFSEKAQLSQQQSGVLFSVFQDPVWNGELFQRLTRMDVAYSITPHLGPQLASDFYEAIQAETEDHIIIPPGKGLALALSDGTITQIFPMHTLVKTGGYIKTRKEVLEEYCGWYSSFLSVMTFGRKSKQFLDWMRDYLGEKIALYFAFLHFYTTWLVPLSFAGGILAFSQYSSQPDNAGVTLYCVFVAVWGALMLEFWQRRNAHLGHEWDSAEHRNEESELIDFVAEEHPDQSHLGFYEPEGAWVEMDEYVKEAGNRMKDIKQFVRFHHRDRKGKCPSWLFCCVPGGPNAQQEANTSCWRFFKTMLTSAVILTLLAGVVAITLGLLVLRLIMQEVNEAAGGLIAGVLNAFSIAILDYLFEGVAVQLNNFEQHRTATQYEDRLIAKQFFFQFINSYFSLFYIAFFKGSELGGRNPTLFGHTDVCKDFQGNTTDSCMAELSFQLTAMLITRLVLGNLIEYGVPKMQLRANIWRIKRAKKREIADDNPDLSEEQIEAQYKKLSQQHRKVDIAEKQAHQPPYSLATGGNVSGTFYDYAELAIQFGYVTLFAPAFPLAPVIALISNVVEHRNDAYKILVSCQKTPYQSAQDMGTWLDIFIFLSYVSVMTNCAVVAFTSNQLEKIFDDPSLALKLFVIVVAEHAIFGLKWIVTYTIPLKPYWVRAAEARTREIRRAEESYRVYLDWVHRAEEYRMQQYLDLQATGIKAEQVIQSNQEDRKEQAYDHQNPLQLLAEVMAVNDHDADQVEDLTVDADTEDVEAGEVALLKLVPFVNTD